MQTEKHTIKEKRTRMRAEERRADILLHAKKVFATYGYSDASTGELAHASDITEPMLYKHFGSKKGLFCAVLKEYSTDFMIRLRARIEHHSDIDILDALDHVIIDYITTLEEDPDIHKIMMQTLSETHDPDIAQKVRKHNEEVYSIIHTLLQRAQHEGYLYRDLDTSSATWGYMNTIISIQYSVVLDLQSALDHHTLQEINRLWLHALRSP
jgi:AcrR family transcriptional regulator